jgi:SAM-dependent methyltransferase
MRLFFAATRTASNLSDNRKRMTAKRSSQASSYAADLVYPSKFVPGQTPLHMRWAAVCAGAPSGPLAGPFDYCDLGCGDGSTLNLLAACNPQGRFIGIDIDAGHIARGRDQAVRAGLGNAFFIEASFADLEALNLPAFDYIASYGVYSWLGAPLQRNIDAFAARHLKPDGLFGVHYSSLPGSTLRDPLNHYLKLLSETQPGDSSARFKAAISQMRQLVRHAKFFEHHSAAAEMLESVDRFPIGAIVHDALNRQPHSYYFSEVCDLFNDVGLEFSGSANLLPDYPELALSREAFSVLTAVTADADIPFREATRDMLLDTPQRFDLFRRPDGARNSSRAGWLACLGELFLQRVGTKQDLEERRQLARTIAADLAAPVCTAMLDFAETPSITIAAALADGARAGFAAAEMERAIEHLFALGFLNVFVRPPLPASPRSDSRHRLSSALNAGILLDTIASRDPEWLASPVQGSPIYVPAAGRLLLLALVGGDLEQAWRSIKAAHPDLRDSRGNPIRDFGHFRAETEQGLPQFVRGALPQLLRVGVVETVD